MSQNPVVACLLAVLSLHAQTQTAPLPGQQSPSRGTGQQMLPNQEPPNPATSGAPLNLSLQDALDRARQYGQQFLAANIAALLAREDTIQAKAALLPTVNTFHQFIYTQPNGTDTGVFVANNGPRVYNNWASVHSDVYSPERLADYHRAIAAEAVARARAEVALRGLNSVVVQNYYQMLAAQRKLDNARQSLREAEDFADLTRKLEQGGEAAHADVVKALLQVEQRRIDLQNAQLDLDKARIAFGILLFPTYGQPYTLSDDLETAPPLPPFSEIEGLASRNNPDIRAAEATVTQQQFEIKASRAALYPTLSFDYFYGMDANQFALRDPEGHYLLGNVAQAQVTIPVWTWGATRSKIRQAELRLQQARNELSLTQRQLLGNLNTFYAEANVSAALVGSLRRSVDLATESLRLTRLRYQAGEATAQEVVDAQAAVIQARNALADGLARYRLALGNLQTVTGVF